MKGSLTHDLIRVIKSQEPEDVSFKRLVIKGLKEQNLYDENHPIVRFILLNLKETS